jgi:CrcB protein
VTREGDGTLLGLVAAGGVLGSLGRLAVGAVLPHASGSFPWSTFVVNVSGSFSMGVLMAWVWSMERPHPRLRPFLGVGVLGGWTTFSSFALDAHTMLDAGRGGLLAAYVVASLVLGIAAVAAGLATGALGFGRHRPGGRL